MSLKFQCPSCNTTQSASDSLAGRRVRCPNCDEMVDVPYSSQRSGRASSRDTIPENPEPPPPDDPTGTVALTPPQELDGDETVMLDSADFNLPRALEVTEPVEIEEVAEPPIQDKPPKPKRVKVEDHDSETNFQTAKRLEETEMDMTPMVDVTFLLLIFFMVTAAFALQKSIEVPKPSDDQASENVIEQDPDDNPDYVTVQVDEFNTYRVITVDWEEEAPSVQDLHIRLRRARDGDSTGTVPTKLLVEANGDSEHGYVVSALDAGTATGFEEVQLSTVEEGDE